MTNPYQADLTNPNPVRSLRNDTGIAITAMEKSITYQLFNKHLQDISFDLQRNGITDQHRVMVVGDNADMISTIIAQWGVMYLGASAGNSSLDQSQQTIMDRAKAGNCDAVLYANTRQIELLSDLSKTTKSHQTERFLLYSSGTTKKADGVYGVEPQFFTYHPDWQGGIAHIDQILLAYKFLGEVPINELSCHKWEVAYAPHNVVQCLLTGGTYHYVDSEEHMIAAQTKYQTNLMSNYPLGYDPICAQGQFDSIEVVDVAGGICTPALIERIRKAINPRVITNSFISSASGTILNRIIAAGDDPEQCVWMEDPHINPTLRLRMDDSNVLWFKRNNSKWITDGDVFEQVGKYYRVVGKANEEYIDTDRGRINTWEIEQFANQLTRTVWGCGEHTYCFALLGRHALVYSGPLNIQLMKDRMDLMEPDLRPIKVIQVDPDFWSLNIKVSRGYMAERLTLNAEYIQNQL